VPVGRGFEDLAVLAAQRPPREDVGAAGLVAAYAGARSLTPPGIGEFRSKLDHARRGRVKRYLKKCFRSCSEFSVLAHGSQRTYAIRGRGEAVLTELFERKALSAADDFLEMEALKRGNSATLVRVGGDLQVVIKRYNIKNLSQGLRRLIRPLPRYRRSWMCGQLLNFLELPTARPLALVEARHRLLPGVAYLVMEDLGGSDLASEVARRGFSEARADEVAGLFVLLKRAGITHGDTKASNFLISDDRIHLIDLDAMRLGLTGFDRDVERFLDNWQDETRRGFEAAFRRAGLI
jgi:serine/threonine protein kinase